MTKAMAARPCTSRPSNTSCSPTWLRSLIASSRTSNCSKPCEDQAMRKTRTTCACTWPTCARRWRTTRPCPGICGPRRGWAIGLCRSASLRPWPIWREQATAPANWKKSTSHPKQLGSEQRSQSALHRSHPGTGLPVNGAAIPLPASTPAPQTSVVDHHAAQSESPPATTSNSRKRNNGHPRWRCPQSRRERVSANPMASPRQSCASAACTQAVVQNK